jgi:selenocysteine-specific elongation factor
VDVPGHEDFVKNMVAGVGAVDVALFVVATDDGWMLQSEEHLQILTYLGVTRAVVALTKIDLAANEAATVAGVRAQLRHSPFADAPVVPTSVVSGRGLEELKTTLARVLADTPAPRDLGQPRLPVDRVFALRGIGTVVTGTLSGGSFARGQAVVVQPGGRPARIRSLQNFNRDVERSGPGTRTALNLPDLDHVTGIRRGDVVTLPELGGTSRIVDVLLEKSGRVSAARPLKNGARVRIHHGSANWPARVRLLEAVPLEAGERALAQLRFESPVFLFAGDRFIVRDSTERATLAGGTVLDPDANERTFRSDARRQFLSARAQAPADAGVWVLSQLQRDGFALRDDLLRKSKFGGDEISAAVSGLVQQGKVIVAGGLAAESTRWRQLIENSAAAIDAGHRAHPERAGLALSELRTAVGKELKLPGAFEAVVAALCAEGFAQTGTAIHRTSHRPALPPNLQAAGNRIRAALAAKPFDPPARRELAPDSNAQQALRFLRESGEVVELNDDVVLLAGQFARAKSTIMKRLREGGAATPSDLRQLLSTTRRVMIPLLERLDREGVTERQGDARVLKRSRLSSSG